MADPRLAAFSADHRKVVAEFGSSLEEVLGLSQKSRVSNARQSLMWVMRKSGMTFEKIAGIFLRDHSTVIYSVQKVDERAAYNPEYRNHLEGLRDKTMDLNDYTESLYKARIAYEDAKAEADRKHAVWRAKETELIDEMLAAHLRALPRDDGTSPTLKKSVACSVTKDNDEEVRKWLIEFTGDDSDFVKEAVSKPAVAELIKAKIAEGMDPIEFPNFLNVSSRPTLVVNGWTQYRQG